MDGRDAAVPADVVRTSGSNGSSNGSASSSSGSASDSASDSSSDRHDAHWSSNGDSSSTVSPGQADAHEDRPPATTTSRSFSLKQMACTFVSSFEYSWDSVTTAFWRKYHPANPFVSHVEAYDVISREVDPATGVMRTVRLVLKRGVLPKWGQFLLSTPQAYVLETSEVDPVRKTMTTVTRNLNHTRLMSVIERQHYQVHPDSATWTQLRTEAKIVSGVGWGLKARIEQFGVSRFQSSTEKSRQALRYTLEWLKKVKHSINTPAPLA